MTFYQEAEKEKPEHKEPQPHEPEKKEPEKEEPEKKEPAHHLALPYETTGTGASTIVRVW